jgi:hypothetical protein
MRKNIESGIQTVLNKKRIEMERRILKSKRENFIHIFMFSL